MSRRVALSALLFLLCVGCGQSEPVSLADQGAKLLRAGDFTKAIAVCTEAVRSDPRDARAYLFRGRAYHCRGAEGDLDRAIADFGESIRLASQDPEAYYSRALAYRDLGDTERSEADEHAARKADPRAQQDYARLPDPVRPAAARAPSDEPAAETTAAATQNSSQPFGASPRPENSFGILGSSRALQEDLDRLRARRKADEPSPTNKNRSQPEFNPRAWDVAGDQNVQRDVAGNQNVQRDAGDDDDGQSPSGRATPGRPLKKPASRYQTMAPQSAEVPAPLPVSPWQTRAKNLYGPNSQQQAAANNQQQPYPGPFRQTAPRPTGYVEPPQNPFRNSPRASNEAPQYSVPISRPWGAVHDDFSP